MYNFVYLVLKAFSTLEKTQYDLCTAVEIKNNHTTYR